MKPVTLALFGLGAAGVAIWLSRQSSAAPAPVPIKGPPLGSALDSVAGAVTDLPGGNAKSPDLTVIERGLQGLPMGGIVHGADPTLASPMSDLLPKAAGPGGIAPVSGACAAGYGYGPDGYCYPMAGSVPDACAPLASAAQVLAAQLSAIVEAAEKDPSLSDLLAAEQINVAKANADLAACQAGKAGS